MPNNRLPLVPQLSSRDGESNKSGRLTNCLKESRPSGGDVAVVRPGLVVSQQLVDGAGRGMTAFNDNLISAYGSALLASVQPDEEPLVSYINSVDGALRAAASDGRGYCVIDERAGANAVAYSADGTTWFYGTMPGTAWKYLGYGNGKFVAISGYYSHHAISLDGLNWTLYTWPSVDRPKTPPVWNGTVWCAAGNGQSWTSADGITWVNHAASHPITIFVEWMVWDGSVFCIAGRNGGFYTSPDGVTWTQKTIPYAANFRFDMTVKGNTVVILERYTGTVLVTSDSGNTWSEGYLPYDWLLDGAGVFAITASSSFFCIPLNEPYQSALFSFDGIHWDEQEMPAVLTNCYTTASNGDTILCVDYAEPTEPAILFRPGNVKTIPSVLSGDFFDFTQSTF